jgi:tocopherol O-methyltransferase
MSGTPEWLKEKVRAYYQETTEKSYLANYSQEALALHYGLSDDDETSLADAQYANNRAIADAIALSPGMRVLDAGCGVGGTSIWMAKERGARMVGVTLDPSQVELAKRFAAERGVADATDFHAMDYMATTFAPASFDGAFNIESLCHSADVPGALRHFAHLLRPGGRYACIEVFDRSASPEVLRAIRDGWSMPTWESSSDAVVEALRGAGFVGAEVIDLTSRVQKSAQQVLALAKNRLLVMKLDAVMGHAESDVFRGHVDAAIACSEGLLAGTIAYAMVRATRGDG